MKKALTFLGFFVFSLNLFSQYNIDYSEFRDLLYKKSSKITSEFIENETKKHNNGYEVSKLLKLANKKNRFVTKYRGQSIFRKCKPYAEKNHYYSKLEKNTIKGIKKDEASINSASSTYMKNLYITRYNNGVNRLKEDSKNLENSLSRLNYCLKNTKKEQKVLIKNYNILQKKLANYYIDKWNNKIKKPQKKYNIESGDEMQWYSSSLKNLLNKAKSLDKMAFVFICNSNKDICQESYNDFFKASSSENNSWTIPYTFKVANFLNKNFISAKFNTKDVSTFIKQNNIEYYPTFIWFNSKGEIIKKELGINTDVLEISKNLIKKQISNIDNFKENLKKKNCDDIFCAYKEVHQIFLNTPDHRKDYKLFNIIKHNAGSLNSPELKWLLNYNQFKDLSLNEKLDIFYSSLEYTYMKETGDYELSDAFNSFATDEKIKPLGKYAQAFKEYLIKDEEGLGFNTNNSKIDRYPVSKNYDSGKLKHKGFRTKKGNYKIGKWFYYYESGQVKSEYELGKDSRIIGKYNTYFENGKLFETCENVKGTKNEKCLQYHKNGKISAKGNRYYWDNSKKGIWSYYYETGELLSKGEYDSNLKINSWNTYHKNGNLRAEGNYTSHIGGTKTGVWSYYKENGKKNIIEEYYYKDRKMKKTEFYPNGKIQYVYEYSYEYNKNVLWRIIDGYDLNGKQTLKNGNGIYKVYNNKTDKLEHTSEMKGGIRSGLANWYYTNGQLKQSVIYKYSEDGNYAGLRWEVLIMFDKERNPLDKGTLKNGNGTWKKYDENGKFISVTNYTNGIADSK